jgi:phosphate transport system permease protein
MYMSAAVVCLLIVGLVGIILYKGLPNITWKFLTTKPALISGEVGILPNILNTLYIIVMTLAVVIPLGVGAAVYLNEYAKNRRAVKAVEIAAETLSGIPSVVYGLVGMLIFVQFFSLGTSLAAGSLTLSVMTLPTVIRTTEESLKTVPRTWHDGAFAMGAGRWQTVRTVVLPSAADGIVTGCILSVGRIIGESAALLFTAGTANEILSFKEAFSARSSGSSLSVSLYMYAKERGDFDTAFAIAAILLILSFAINLSAEYAAKKMKRHRLQGE